MSTNSKEYTKSYATRYRKELNEYQRNWRKENPEKYLAIQIRHMQKKLQKLEDAKAQEKDAEQPAAERLSKH